MSSMEEDLQRKIDDAKKTELAQKANKAELNEAESELASTLGEKLSANSVESIVYALQSFKDGKSFEHVAYSPHMAQSFEQMIQDLKLIKEALVKKTGAARRYNQDVRESQNS